MARPKKEDKPKRLPQRGKGKPFTKGNELWKNRNPLTTGAPLAFESPDELLRYALGYFAHIDAHPLNEVVKGMGSVTELPVLKNGELVGLKPNTMKLPKAMPYTLEGLCVWCGVGASYFRTFKVTKTTEKHGAFLAVLDWIEAAIFNQNYSLSFAGHGSAALVAAKFGMTQKVEQTNTNINLNSEPLTPERAKEIARNLEKDC